VLAIIAIVIAGAALLSHTAPAPFVFEAFRPAKSIWRVSPQPGAPPTIYLTFDDGPNAAWTPALLDALAAEHAQATFFLIDDHITDETTPLVRRIASDGHAIALHSGTRRPVVTPPEILAGQLKHAADRIASITGQTPCPLFRPHAGWRSASMYEALDRNGYRLAGWSWGMWDWSWWRQADGARTAKRLAKKASAGDIVVMHDGHHKNPRADRRQTAEAVRVLVPALRAKGFVFGRLCEPVARSG
jgi:peptidoglycan/xylan/chitin deacetylase (PgdA/CDA1 family)